MLAKLVLFGYFALGGASKAYFNEYFKHHAMAKELHGKMNLSMAHYKPQPIEDDESDSCKKCYEGVYGWIKVHVKQWLDEKCEKPECKKMAEFCDFRNKAPRVVAGMFIFWTRPTQSAEAYCIGAKACQPKDSIEESTPDMVTRTLNDMMGDINLGESFDLKEAYMEEKKLNVLQINDFMVELEMSNFEHKEEDFEMEEYEHPPPDRKCMGDVMKHIMVVVIKKVVHWCMTSTCPKKKEICEWAGKHKPESYGFMLAAVEPWKVAYGYCFPHEEARLIRKEKLEDSIFA